MIIRFLTCILLANAALGQSPEALQKHVAYLASDKLKGRPLPSPGLDAAATFVAGQFETIGLQPAGDDRFFQTYERVLMRPDWTGYEFTIHNDKQAIHVLRTELLPFSANALRFDNEPLIKVDSENGAWLKGLRREDVQGKILAIRIVAQSEGEDMQENFRDAMDLVSGFSPALILMYGPTAAAVEVPGVLMESGEKPSNQLPRFPVRTDAFRSLMESMPAGQTKLRVTLHLRAPVFEKLKLHNVAGILRGSDPVLKDSFDIVTANYDGFPMRRLGDDPISNSANSNASGAAAVIEMARALAAGPKLKRSILFLATSGETPDGAGAKYYQGHPLVPLEKTAACFNLLHLGRTDSLDGPKIADVTVTGFQRSKFPELFQKAGAPLGVRIHADNRDPEGSRGFTPLLLALKVPSHTIYVAMNYADFHRVSDEANKLDYNNMAKVVRALTAGLILAANSGPE